MVVVVGLDEGAVDCPGARPSDQSSIGGGIRGMRHGRAGPPPRTRRKLQSAQLLNCSKLKYRPPSKAVNLNPLALIISCPARPD